MKRQSVKAICLAAVVAVAGLAVATTDARAQDRAAGPYFHTDLGASFVEDIKLTTGGTTFELEFDPGIRFSIGGGYRFYPSPSVGLALEFDTGVIWNSLDRVKVLGTSVSVDGDLYQVPFLGNVVLSLEPTPQWVLYAGGGGGGVYGRVSVDRIGGLSVRARDDDVEPAAQAMAGLRYQMTERSSLGVGYKFLNMFVSGDPDIRTHSVGLTYALSF
jgi:opacity protein-like surface antigen